MSTPTPAASGTATPVVELNAEQAALSLKVSLADLSAQAASQYAQKNYDEAAELYAQAAEMQAEMNGEMNPDNAEILFLYGRALFKVGQSKSDVLGGRAPEPKPEKKTAKSKKQKKAATEENREGSSSLIKEAVEQATKGTQASIVEAAKEIAHKDEPNPEKKPLFHFEGDENFDDSDEEEEDEDAEEGEEEDEDDDDLAVAFQVLDLARVLHEQKLATLEAEEKTQEEGKGKEKEGEEAATTTETPPLIKHIKERLGDLHDLLAEISLENERYPAAITDSRASLKYKQQLYPQDSEIIAEAHFKLSLALEFASVTKSSDDDSTEKAAGAGGAAGVVDQALRDEAAAELEAAIASTKLKLQNKEVELASTHNPEDNDATRRQIADVKEVIADMEQRLVDLRKPPIDINEALGIAAPVSGAKEDNSSLKVAEEVKEKANDLTGLVKRKRKVGESEAAPAEEGAPEAKKLKEE
ncbi:hypothetical protein B0H65DRAFT_489593 [Neurospora tetraspora]|uniref:Tetratricopeptide SHNi-TPR domain-containing protein n=1 Tax=Neurospora tetraspora TaxID=94610 RepID=A0AAE0JLA4_9PEZI|nr:hypothetical protein B0H65DRAFT_489593 [Neurospora tetraspora]